ncbi:MAG TPA: hypothetical protein DCG48_11420 [Rhodospirillaceae bacterium]|nr:hypothetical protein [Rhodospirillaceae bacterium]
MKNAVVNSALLLGSTVLVWLVIELALFPALVPHLPMRLHSYLGEVAPLAQSSKRGLRPEGDWVLLVGDSYAKGNGDWFLSVDKDANPPFQAAHVLHERSGRDVLNFGLPGAGNVYGWNRLPEEHMTWLHLSWRYDVAAPATVFAYFYEGNDLNDNLKRVRLHYPDGIPDGFFEGTAAVDRFIEAEAAYMHHGKKTLFYNMFAAKFVRRLVRGEWHRRRDNAEGRRATEAQTMDAPAASNSAAPRSANRLLIGGKVVGYAGGLQSPAMELNELETEGALLITARSLLRLKRQFQSSRIVVVYIPSPLSIYEPAAGDFMIQTYQGGPNSFAASDIRRRSDALCQRVNAIVHKAGLEFVDARAVLRNAAQIEPIHGPKDWKHLNETGHRSLAGVLEAGLFAGRPSKPCGKLADN